MGDLTGGGALEGGGGSDAKIWGWGEGVRGCGISLVLTVAAETRCYWHSEGHIRVHYKNKY